MNYQKLVDIIRMKLNTALEERTSWGKEQAKRMVDTVLLSVQGELIDELVNQVKNQ